MRTGVSHRSPRGHQSLQNTRQQRLDPRAVETLSATPGSTTLTKAEFVNWLPESVLTISGRPKRTIASSSASGLPEFCGPVITGILPHCR